MSNFVFLQPWSDIQENAQQAEALLKSNPRASCFYSRYTLERMVHWMYEHDNWLSTPKYDSTLNTLINQADFKRSLGSMIFPKIKLVQKSGNQAVHSQKAIRLEDAVQTLKELHHILYWFYKTYSPSGKFENQVFSLESVPTQNSIAPELLEAKTKQLKALGKSFEEQDKKHQEKLEESLKHNQALRAELEQLKAKITEQKEQNQETTLPDSHDYSEAETRKYLIDQYLTEMGWDLDAPNVKEFEVEHMPNKKVIGYVDYVLWGDNGKPLAVVEAKRTTIDPEQGRQQAVLYADCLQKMFGQRPLIYFTNGYDIHFWDDMNYPPRMVQGFLGKEEAKRLIERRDETTSVNEVKINTDIAAGDGRIYQRKAIQRVCELFANEKQRKSLLVMATGTGKTRTTIAIVDVLMRAGIIKNVLFLADRNALMSQAKKEFNKLLSNSSPSILTSGTDSLQGRVYLSTYPTMLNLLNKPPEARLFGVGHFDLVIVDEAHRSVYRKYRYIFDYFDSLLLGLTATPKSELDKNTYEIFEMPDGEPTFAYELEQAVADGFLVPPKRVDVGLGFIREGIHYDDLSDEEKEEWESKEELSEREEVLPSEVNQFLFNIDTVDKALKVLFEKGIKVAAGDRLAKTIVFAANNKHAEFIVERLNTNYPKYKGKFARVITYKENYAETLIEEFKGEREPLDPNIPLTIAVSVDMLDTGVDVPEVANLVFFKVIKSKVKFMQMIGRGTRLCANLFGPDSPEDDKKDFKVFDICGNFEYFDQNPEGAKDAQGQPLSQRIFEKRLDLASLLKTEDNEFAQSFKKKLLGRLNNEVKEMNFENFIVRPKRKEIEPYLSFDRWKSLDEEAMAHIKTHISSLPSEYESDDSQEANQEMALQFDHFMLTMQLAKLDKTGISDLQKMKLNKLVSKLEAKASIPAVADHLEWIQYIQTANFWQDVTLEELEYTRKNLRMLMQYIDKEVKDVVYTNFTDTVHEIKEHEGVWLPQGNELDLYRKKVEAFIKSHQDDITIQRIKRKQPLTELDLKTLEQRCYEASGIDSWKAYEKTVHPEQPLDEFVRSLVGLDREAVLEMFSEYLDESRFNANQIEFIQLIVNYLTENGSVPNLNTLVEDSYFTGKFSGGVVKLFDQSSLLGIKALMEDKKLIS